MKIERAFPQILFIVSGVAFIAASVLGLLGAANLAQFAVMNGFPPFEILRPLHTFLVISALLIGLQAFVLAIIGDHLSRAWVLIYAGALAMFVVGGVAALATGHGTGREYFSWPALVSAPLLAALSMFLWKLFQAAGKLERRSPEGFWLVGLGGVFIVTGLLESHLWSIPAIASNFVKDLTIQWHGIDTFFAGVNTVLYGCGVFVLSKKSKPLRSRVLFAVAGISLLFTFGHHHYVSPQPDFLKTLAFLASMLAMVSFLRHVAAYKTLALGKASRSYAPALWRTVQLWTLISIATGVLFAIPQINLIVHGTYLVMIHAMGSMIGVDFMIVIVGGLVFGASRLRIRPARVRWGVRLVNVSLIGLWLVLGAAGLAKGVIRIGGDYYDFQPLREMMLIGFPLAGALLLCGIVLLSSEMIRANLAVRRKPLTAPAPPISFGPIRMEPGGYRGHRLLFERAIGGANRAPAKLERRAKKWEPVFRETGATTRKTIASGDPDLSPDAIVTQHDVEKNPGGKNASRT